MEEVKSLTQPETCAPSLIIKDKVLKALKWIPLVVAVMVVVWSVASVATQELTYKTVIYRIHIVMLNGETRDITMTAIVIPGDYLTLTDGCIYIQNTARCNPQPYCGVKKVVLTNKEYADN